MHGEFWSVLSNGSEFGGTEFCSISEFDKKVHCIFYLDRSIVLKKGENSAMKNVTMRVQRLKSTFIFKFFLHPTLWSPQAPSEMLRSNQFQKSWF